MFLSVLLPFLIVRLHGKYFFEISLKSYGSRFFFQCNCAKTDVKYTKNSFLRQVGGAWCDVAEINFGNKYIIWNTSYVKIDSKTVFYDNLYDKRVMKIIHLFNVNYVPLDYLTFTRNSRTVAWAKPLGGNL